MADFGVTEGIAVAGLVASVAASAAAAKAQSDAASFNQKVAQNNAQAAQDQAAYENSLKKIQLEKTLGAQRAAAGMAGVTGQSLEAVQYNTLVMGKYDQLATKYEANVSSNRSNSEASLFGAQGSNALIGGAVGGAGTALSGGGKVYASASGKSGTGLEPDFYG